MRSVPLRLKLVTALVIPMLVVAGYLALSVADALDQRRVASAQADEVTRFEAVAEYAGAIGAENVVLNDPSKSVADLVAARAATDVAMDRLRSEELGLDDEVLDEIEVHHAELVAIRDVLGSDAASVRAAVADEIRTGNAEAGEVVPRLIRLADLYPLVLAAYDADPAAVVDVRTMALLTDYELLQRVRAEFARETSTIQRVGGLPADAITPEVTEFVGVTIANTDQAIESSREVGSAAAVERIDAFLASEDFRQHSILRNRLNDTPVGVAPVDLDPLEVQATGARVDLALTALGEQVVDDLQAQADATLAAANRELIRSAMIGVVLLVVVALVLRLLYRAIKSPLERLTERSRQIADVELPGVVAAMRRGEIDEIPEVEEIPVESNDEIGDLVQAFNGMHRTAVELAAEQAGSRRVVADMFVNLGRRNQRLVNRLLKGLTSLEQHEEDPDKLAALYDVDHVATRMRRNAESLLILAGASQSRRWDQPVSMYDIARAALSEVENYERVDIDTGGEVLIDGSVVADLTHLLAELVENALSFSPPSTRVEIVARSTSKGFVIAVSDRGVGMPSELMVDANRRIARAAEQEETPSEFLGHYVVGRLAARHDIRVDLLDGMSGGVTARVVLPQAALATDLPDAASEAPDIDLPAPVGEPAIEAVAEPMVEGVAEPTADAVAEPMVEGVAEPASDAVAEPMVEGVAEPGEVAPRGPQQPTPIAATFGEQPRRRRPDAPEAPVSSMPDASDAPELPALPELPDVPDVSVTPAVSDTGAMPAPSAASVPPAELAAPAPSDAPDAPAGPPPSSFDWPPAEEVDPLLRHRSVPPEPADLSALRPTEPVAPAGPTEPVGPAEPAEPVAPTVEREATLAELAATPRDDVPLPPLAGTGPSDIAAGAAEPAPAPTFTPGATSSDELARAAEEAVNGALTAFGSARRTPGASMPNTSLIASIAGSMGSPFADSSGSALPPDPAAVADAGEPDRVRSTLAGFQSGVDRADRED